LRFVNYEDNVGCREKVESNSKIALLLTLFSKIRSQGNIRWSARATEKNNTVSVGLVVSSEEKC
jgi:hypothetical protein